MNILVYFISQINPQCGGTERVADTIAHGLKNLGHCIFYMSNTSVPGVYDIPCYFLPETGITKQNIVYLNQFIKEHDIDVIINEAGNCNEIYLFSNEHVKDVKIITCLHFNPLLCQYYYRGLYLPLSIKHPKQAFINILKWIKAPFNKHKHERGLQKRYKYMAEHSNKVVVLTHSYIEDFCQMGNIENRENVISIYNPTSFPCQDIDFTKKEKEILFVGRLDPAHKRVDYLIKIWGMIADKYPDWRLTIVGDGPDMEHLLKTTKREKIERVHFEGRQDSLPYYKRASILCMTSIYEGSPMVIVEAMQYGCVPIVYDTFKASHDLIDNGNTGYIIPPFETEEYASKLSILMGNEDLHQQMGEAAKASTERFEIEGIIDQWEELIKGR